MTRYKLDVVDEILRPRTQNGEFAPLLPADSEARPVNQRNVNITIDLDDMRKLQSQAAQCRYDIVVNDNKLKAIARADMVMGTESVVSTTVNILAGSVNLFTQLLDMFRVKFQYNFADFKRSELSDYYCSNRLSMMRLKHANLYSSPDIKLEIPDGMVGTYNDALSATVDYLGALKMADLSKSIDDHVTKIFDAVTSPGSNFTNYLASSRRLVSSEVNSKFQAMCKQFNETGKTEMKSFDEVFPNCDFMSVVDRCMVADDHFRLVSLVSDYLDSVHGNINRIIESIDINPSRKISSSQVSELSGVIRLFAETFDSYSLAINYLSKINHNLYINVKQIRGALDI